MPPVTIIMRSGNAGLTLEPTLIRIREQSFTDYELLNYDLGSEDGSYELLKKFNPRTSRTEKTGSSPGQLLNHAVRKAKGELVVFLDGNCLPVNNSWLANLIHPLCEENSPPAIGGRLITPGYLPLFHSNGPEFSLQAAAIRRDFLIRYPFDPGLVRLTAEEWAFRIGRLGYEIAFAADAEAIRPRPPGLAMIYQESYQDGLARGHIYGYRPNWRQGMLRPWLTACRADAAALLRQFRFYALPEALIYRGLACWGDWRGRRDFFVQARGV